VAAALAENETVIVETLINIQGEPQDVGGYYKPDLDRANAAMCPSAALNEILEAV
jgi:isocitrate dehydrogenase